jgi:type VI secretion system secreted protein VgrG
MAVFELSWGALPVKGSCVGFKHKEGISELFELDLYVVLKEETELDVEELLLTRASLDVRFSESLLDVVIPPMQVAGTVTAMELLRMEADLALYRVRLSPQLWLLTQSVHSRVWTQKTLEEIATAVLEESGLIAGEDFELKISSPLPKEEHVTQYKESSFDFLSRWFEREGWYYYFEHEGGKDKLIVTDDRSAHESLRASPIRYVPQSGADGSASDAFDNVTQRLRLMPAGVRLTDYDYAKPGLELSGRAAVSPPGDGRPGDVRLSLLLQRRRPAPGDDPRGGAEGQRGRPRRHGRPDERTSGLPLRPHEPPSPGAQPYVPVHRGHPLRVPTLALQVLGQGGPCVEG